jgi:hypothetical protein
LAVDLPSLPAPEQDAGHDFNHPQSKSAMSFACRADRLDKRDRAGVAFFNLISVRSRSWRCEDAPSGLSDGVSPTTPTAQSIRRPCLGMCSAGNWCLRHRGHALSGCDLPRHGCGCILDRANSSIRANSAPSA